MPDSPLASSSLLSKNELFREIRNSEKFEGEQMANSDPIGCKTSVR